MVRPTYIALKPGNFLGTSKVIIVFFFFWIQLDPLPPGLQWYLLPKVCSNEPEGTGGSTGGLKGVCEPIIEREKTLPVNSFLPGVPTKTLSPYVCRKIQKIGQNHETTQACKSCTKLKPLQHDY